MSRERGDRLQVDLRGDLRRRLDYLIATDPIYRGRSLADAIRLLLDDALPELGPDTEPLTEAEGKAVEFVRALAHGQKPDLLQMQQLADGIGVESQKLAALVALAVECCCDQEEEKNRRGKAKS